MASGKIILITLLVLLSLISINAIEIKTCSDLSKIREDLSGEYKLVKNIDCKSHGEFEPIGGHENGFKGKLDGQGFYIQDLTIKTGAGDGGLFGHAEKATIENLTIDGVKISGEGKNVGVIVGHAVNSKIQKCFVGLEGSEKSNEVSGNESIGGIVGLAEGSSLSQCVVTNLLVQAKNDVAGGIAGSVSKESSISQCVNRGFPKDANKLVVSASSKSGGLCGQLSDSEMSKSGIERGEVKAQHQLGGAVGHVSNGNFEEIYSLEVQLDGLREAGGLIGNLYLSKNSAVKQCLSRTSKVTALQSSAGGLFGAIYYKASDVLLEVSGCITASFVKSVFKGIFSGSIDAAKDIRSLIKVDKVLYDKDVNPASVLTVAHFVPATLSDTLEGEIVGVDSKKLNAKASSTLDQNVWNGDRLKVESEVPQPEPTLEPTPTQTPKPHNSAHSLVPAFSLVLFIIVSLLF